MARITRNTVIDDLRGLAILIVIGIHFFDFRAFVSGTESKQLFLVYRIFGHGYYGVNIFFVISGFLIASTSVRESGHAIELDAAKFYARRATRIFPLLGVAVALTATLTCFGPVQDAVHPYMFRASEAVLTGPFWLSIATFTFNWFRIAQGFSHGAFGLSWDVLWSLAVEEQFYVLFPIVIALAGTKPRMQRILIAVIVLGTVVRAILVLGRCGTVLIQNNSLTCFDALAIGVMVASKDVWDQRRSLWAKWIGLVGLGFFYLLPFDSLAGLPVLGVALSTALIIQASRRDAAPAARPRLRRSVLGGLGHLSYGAYLLHTTILFVLRSWIFSAAINPLLGFALAVLAVYAVAWLSSVLFERPVERAGRGFLYRLIMIGRSKAVARHGAELRYDQTAAIWTAEDDKAGRRQVP